MTATEQDRADARLIAKEMEWAFEDPWEVGDESDLNGEAWRVSNKAGDCIASWTIPWTRETIAPVQIKIADMNMNQDFVQILMRVLWPDYDEPFTEYHQQLALMLADGPTRARACAAAIREGGDGK